MRAESKLESPLTYTRPQLAELLQVTPDTVSQMVARNELPEPFSQRPMRWWREQVRAWIERGPDGATTAPAVDPETAKRPR